MISDKFYKKVNGEYSEQSKEQRARELLTKSLNVEEAIVSFFSTTGIAGFKFHIPEKEEILLQNEITDHYIDTNRPVQDHIAEKPVLITLEGLQGDYLHTVHPFQTFSSAVVVADPLVRAFLPKLAPVTQWIKSKTGSLKTRFQINNGKVTKTKATRNQVFKLSGGASKTQVNYVDMWNLFQSLYKLRSAQTRAFLFFEAVWKSQALFTVDTSWKRYNNMVVQSIRAVRDESADITKFSITCKQLSFVESKVNDLNNTARRTREQLEKAKKKGVDKGTKVS